MFRKVGFSQQNTGETAQPGRVLSRENIGARCSKTLVPTATVHVSLESSRRRPFAGGHQLITRPAETATSASLPFWFAIDASSSHSYHNRRSHLAHCRDIVATRNAFSGRTALLPVRRRPAVASTSPRRVRAYPDLIIG